MNDSSDAATATGGGISIIMPVYNGHDFIVRSLPPLVGMVSAR